MPAYDAKKSLTDNLSAFGFLTAQQATPAFYDVVAPTGEVVREGRETDLRAWLSNTGGCLGDGVKVPHLACCPYAAF